MYKKMNIMKKVLAVASGVTDGFGGDQDFRDWAEMNGLDFMAFHSANPESHKAMIIACEQGKLDFCKWLFKKLSSED